MSESETIAAISTPHGRGGVSVVRVSGPDAFAVAAKVTGRAVDASMAGTFFFSKFMRDDEVLDSGIVLVFAGPKSYTGEDVVELQGHGGTVVPGKILDAVIAAGARLARRGEFTQRAFLNGRLDLTEAEAVIDLIDAKTERSAKDALSRLEGAHRETFEELYEKTLALSADVEHALDFSEDELPPDFTAKIRRRAHKIAKTVSSALDTAREGKILRDGALVVLAGEPNVGKSSLMNALLKENRAIVSDVAGTTRDSIEECLDVDGWPVRLVDTAGLRSTDDAIEAEGVERSEKLIADADIVLRLVCATDAWAFMESGVELGEKEMLVLTKTDLARGGIANTLAVSAVTGKGLDELRRAIVGRLRLLSAKGDETAADINQRQREKLLVAKEAFDRADAALKSEAGDLVIAANEFRNAAEAVGAVVGKTYSEDLLDQVFSRFCVGK